MGLNYVFLGDLKKAHKYLDKGYKTFMEHFGADHFETARTLQYMGIVAFWEERLKEAQDFFESALVIFSKNNHPKMALSHEYLSKIKERLKKVGGPS